MAFFSSPNTNRQGEPTWAVRCGAAFMSFFRQNLPLLVSSLAILSGVLTYVVITYGGLSLTKKNSFVTPFILFDGLLILLLTWIIVLRIRDIYREQKRGLTGSRLYITIISTFFLVTVTPSVLMGVLALTVFKSGVSVWFNRPVQDTLNDASVVAGLYLEEHTKNIGLDVHHFAAKMAPILNEYDPFSKEGQAEIQKEMDRILEELKLEEAFIRCARKGSLDANLLDDAQVNISSSLAISLELLVQGKLGDELAKRQQGEEPIIVNEGQGMVFAVEAFDSGVHDAIFNLWISKRIDPNILKYVTKARNSKQYYNDLLASLGQFQTTLMILFVLSSLLLLLGAIWVGISLSSILVEPITRLMTAAEQVSRGNLTVRVPETRTKTDLDTLVASFNRMIARLEQQNKDLIISEKKSAWSDIARKIAHEVKNPLTPIQLSAERLKRKYGKEIRSDPATFIKCIDTIIRQVSHIENLISEFSAFARMPEAVMQPVDVISLVREAVFMQKQAYPNLQFQMFFPKAPIIWPCDSQQIFQVLVNLLQNAVNAIVEQGVGGHGPEGGVGRITVTVVREERELKLVIEDNGPGFPSEKRERLFEPYYTTRAKGTGLGMAIVLRIITEHSGTLKLLDAQGHPGARVEIRIPLLTDDQGSSAL